MKTGYVGFLMRLAGGIIDAICLGIISGIPIALILIFERSSGHRFANVLFVQMNLVAFMGWLYFAILESSKLQGSVGKVLLGIVVVGLNHERISFGRATGRYLGIVISVMTYGIGFLFPLWTKQKRALPDFIAGTMLVYRGTKNENIGVDASVEVEGALSDAKLKILARMRESGELSENEYQIALDKLHR